VWSATRVLATCTSVAERPAARPTVLVVDDEDTLRVAIQRLLESHGFQVITAPNGAAALQLLEDDASPKVSLVLTDLRMPVMDGRQLAAALARRHPSLPIVFMSGFTAQLMDLRLVSPHVAFLAKPFRDHDLLATIRGQIAQPE
jgi:two-component system, cell cycle sensor histidine kinase and response regulator CckA